MSTRHQPVSGAYTELPYPRNSKSHRLLSRLALGNGSYPRKKPTAPQRGQYLGTLESHQPALRVRCLIEGARPCRGSRSPRTSSYARDMQTVSTMHQRRPKSAISKSQDAHRTWRTNWSLTPAFGHAFNGPSRLSVYQWTLNCCKQLTPATLHLASFCEREPQLHGDPWNSMNSWRPYI